MCDTYFDQRIVKANHHHLAYMISSSENLRGKWLWNKQFYHFLANINSINWFLSLFRVLRSLDRFHVPLFKLNFSLLSLCAECVCTQLASFSLIEFFCSCLGNCFNAPIDAIKHQPCSVDTLYTTRVSFYIEKSRET